MTVAIVVVAVVGAAQMAPTIAFPGAGQVAGAIGTPPATPRSGSPGADEPRPVPTPAIVPDGGMDIARHRAPAAPSPSRLIGYRWPLTHARLTLPFGPTPWGSRVVDGEHFHDGVDLATFCGDRIMAAHDGVVLAASRHYDSAMGWDGDLGPYLRRLDKKHLWATLPIVVVIDDGNGYRSIYAHFERLTVKKGDRVKAGKVIGYEGATGRATGCHLHYGLFSPAEKGRFGIDSGVVKRMKVPRDETARIDPLLVLPERTKHPRPTPTPDPNAKPTPTPSPETVG